MMLTYYYRSVVHEISLSVINENVILQCYLPLASEFKFMIVQSNLRNKKVNCSWIMKSHCWIAEVRKNDFGRFQRLDTSTELFYNFMYVLLWSYGCWWKYFKQYLSAKNMRKLSKNGNNHVPKRRQFTYFNSKKSIQILQILYLSNVDFCTN